MGPMWYLYFVGYEAACQQHNIFTNNTSLLSYHLHVVEL